MSAIASLRAALVRAGDALPRLAEPADPAPFDPYAVRAIRVTGAGSSAAHARFLAALLAEELALPARFVPLDAFPRRGDPREALVVFSQGLAPNAQLALANTDEWAKTVLVTGAEGSQDPARRAAVAQLRATGVAIAASGPGDEYGTLLRLEGPVAGYVAALRLARSLGLPPAPELARAPAAYHSALARGAALAAEHASAFAKGPVLLLASGTYREAVDNLRLKLTEGLQRPFPPVADPIELAHGPFQALAAAPALLVALTRPDALHEPARLRLVAALAASARHTLVTLPAELPGFLAIFEHEALVGALVVEAMEHAGLDPTRWPGRGADEPVYGLAAALPGRAARPAAPSHELARLAWPEVETALREGRRLAVLPLGATEQHGPHLPLDTDTRIADALAARFCARVPRALRLPVVAVGASREHLAFPGTLSLAEDTLARVLADLVRSLVRHGFEEIFCFSAHGGNLGVLREHDGALVRAAAPGRWIALADHGAITARLHALAARAGVDSAAAGHHAGELETSILARLAPGSLRTGTLAPGLLEVPADTQSIFYPDLRAHAPSGTVGDPRAASPDRADLYLDAWAEELVTAYEDAKKSHQTKGTVKP